MFRIEWTRLLWILGLALTLGSASSSAHADDVSTDPSGVPADLSTDPAARPAAEQARPGIEEMVVTARKRQENVQDVPIAITVMGGQFVQTLNPRDLSDLEGYVPNMIIDPVAAGPGIASFYIRGVWTQEVERTFDPAVSLFLDGVYLTSTSGTMLQTWDVEAVEVLRGPQGTLFGKNTIGGAVTFNRTRPTGEFGLKSSITLGSHGRNDYGTVANAPIIDDVLAGKFSFFRNNDEGAWRNEARGGSRGYGDRVYSWTAELLFTPNEQLDVLVKYEKGVDDTDSGPLLNIAGPGELQCGVGVPLDGFQTFCGLQAGNEKTTQNHTNDIHATLDAVTVQANYDLDPVLLTFIGGWRSTDETVNQDFDAIAVDWFSTKRDQTHRQWSSELRASGQYGIVDMVTGFYFVKSDYGLDQSTFFFLNQLDAYPPALGGSNGADVPPNAVALSNQGQDAWSWALFGHADVQLTEQLTLEGGVRYTAEKKDFTGAGGVNFAGFGPEVSGSKRWGEWTGTIGLQYQAMDDLMTYAKYSKGYRSGGWNGRNNTQTSIGPYDPEKVYSYEGGFKSTWLDNHLQLNGAIFYTNYDNKQEELIQPDPILGSATVVLNASEVDLWGWELEAISAPFEGLTLRGNIGYLDAEYDDYVADLNNDGNITDNSNLELRRSPEWQYGVFGEYQRPVGPGKAFATLGFRWTDDVWVDASNDPRGDINSVGFLDASIGFDWDTSRGTYTVTVFGRNLHDRVGNTAAVIVPGLLAFGAPREGRTWGVTLMTDF